MLLSCFTEEAYDRLLSSISDNTEKYLSDEEWLPAFFDGQNNYYLKSSVDVQKFNPYYSPGKKDTLQKTREDLVNVRLMYESFRQLSPLQASNKYLWTYLCHAVPEYRTYIQDRWMQDERENTIRTRFFVTSADSLRNDNALSRLWWAGYLTYDESNHNHYALTEILLTNQTIWTDVMDTFNCMNRNRMFGVLTAIRDFSAELNDNEGITEYFRECKKYLNHYAAVTTLEFLDKEEIRDLAYNYMIKIRNEKRKSK